MEVSILEDPMPWPDHRAPATLWHAARVAWWARRRRVQVVHCNEHDLYPFGQLVRRILRVPVVCHVRYLLHREYAQWAFRGRRAPDALLWTSCQQQQDSADAIAGLMPEEQQHMVRLGVDLDSIDSYAEAGQQLRRSWGIDDDEILVGIPSPLRPRKRVHEFIELFRRIAPRHPQTVGVVAGGLVPGDERYRDDIARQIDESGLGRRLRWVGHLDPVEPFHHACDISVSTSEYETFGNSVCEAMACGKPVAAYRGGSVAEVLGDAGLVVETGDIDGLTAAVDRLVNNSPLRAELGQCARHRVEKEFHPAKSLKQLSGIYASLLAGASRG